MKRSVVLICLLILLFGFSSVYAQSASIDELICDLGLRPAKDSQLMVKEGDEAPDFSLPSIKGEDVRLSDFRGKKNVVISFVPAAWTQVCSDQWRRYGGFQDALDTYDAVMVGITADNLPTLRAWSKAMDGVWFEVLSDFWPHGEVAQSFGVLRSDGISERAVFVIDKDGIIQYAVVSPITEMPDPSEIVMVLERLDRIKQ
jgi:peroxiredoxin